MRCITTFEIVWRIAALLFGVFVIFSALSSAVRSLVLPRSTRDAITFFVFVVVRRVMLIGHEARSYAERDRLMAFYAPVSLLMMPVTWLALVVVGYLFIYEGLGVTSIAQSFAISGSSLFTLGTASNASVFGDIAMFSEALVGLLLMALLISYLPTMYNAFSRREIEVTLLEYRAGTPPSGVDLILRFHNFGTMALLEEFWSSWERWFVELEETHTSLPPLVFFRSPRPERSWITAAGVVLDAAVLTITALDAEREPRVNLAYRAGMTALCRVADYFAIEYEAHADKVPAISITRSEFDAAMMQFREAGIAVKANSERAWQEFKMYRARYDAVLLQLATLTMAPEAKWVSDRSLSRPPTSVFRRRARARRKVGAAKAADSGEGRV